jgi:hypothetical protein
MAYVTMNSPVLAVVAGLSAHLFVARFELWPRALLLVTTAGLGAGVSYMHLGKDVPFGASLLMATRFTSILLTTMFASMTIYRIFFHRLASIPGPLSLKLTKWSLVSTDLNGQRAHYIKNLHEQYGDVVRTGPREVSINSPAVIAAIGGASSPCQKGPWYIRAHGGKGPRALSLHSTVDKGHHSARRRIWDAGFNAKALRSYEMEIKRTTDALVEQMQVHSEDNKVVNLEEWCMFYGFDIMGKVGFSRSFDLIGQASLSRGVKVSSHLMLVYRGAGLISFSPLVVPL